ncbi:hypothetical protein ACWD6R_39215 [Streptomyces sp. NPDC005151]
MLIRARTFVAAKPMEVLPDGTYLTRMNLAGQRRSHPGGVRVRVIDYQFDEGKTTRLLTDLLDPVSQYIVRKKDQVRRGTRRVPEKVITLTPAILQ